MKNISFEELRKMGKNILPDDYQYGKHDDNEKKKEITIEERKRMLNSISSSGKQENMKNKLLGSINKLIQSDDK